MSTRRGRLRAATAVALWLIVASCGAEGPERADATWGTPAEALFEEIGAAYDANDPYAVTRFFTLGGSLDVQAWQLGVITDPLEMVDALRSYGALQEWFAPDVARVEDLYLSREGAIARFVSSEVDGGFGWVQLYAMGRDGSVASRVFRDEFRGDPTRGWSRPGDHDFYDRYVAAWATGDADELAAVYAPGAVIRDGLSGRSWDGLEALRRDLGPSEPVEPGAWPQLYFYRAFSYQEFIALVQIGGPCPRFEARRWVLDKGRIAEEVRFAHLPSVRRCGLEVHGGWWDDFEVPPETDRYAQSATRVGADEIVLINADDRHVDFVAWLSARFEAAGLDPPNLGGIWFLPSFDCSEQGSYARREDSRFAEGHSVTLCFDGQSLQDGARDGSWSDLAVRFGLHELAHVWMYDHIDDELRAAFTDRADLAVWRSADALWAEQGVEHAAETIAWGLADADDARYDVTPVPECDELAARFELLTGRSPLTSCATWSRP